MKRLAFAAASACLFGSAAQADDFNNTQLAPVNGVYGAGIATTTTDANGTTTTVVGPGGGANRASAPFANETWLQSEVGGGGTVGITKTYTNDGDGAAYFSTTSGDSKGDLHYYFEGGAFALSSLTSVSFDFFRDAASTTNANFAPVLRFDMLKNGGYAGSLVFEGYYQNQTAPTAGVWNTQAGDLTHGIWWATNAALGPTFAAADGGEKTLQDWINDNGNSTLSVYGVSIGVGSGWNDTFSGAIDHVAYNFAGGPGNDWNFAVADDGTPAVPEPATWAMMIGGFGMVGGAMRRRRSATLAAA